MGSNNKRPLQTLSDFKDSVTRILVSMDQIICGSVDGVLRSYDVRMGKIYEQDFERRLLKSNPCSL